MKAIPGKKILLFVYWKKTNRYQTNIKRRPIFVKQISEFDIQLNKVQNGEKSNFENTENIAGLSNKFYWVYSIWLLTRNSEVSHDLINNMSFYSLSS